MRGPEHGRPPRLRVRAPLGGQGECRVQTGPVGSAAEGFEYQVLGDGRVRISHAGRVAAGLRGAAATDFLEDVEKGDPQLLMARVTGNYKRGNERTARNHPRNRAR
ncbi:hypothetical protein GCM10009616_28990 [Microlunatus lacustris]